MNIMFWALIILMLLVAIALLVYPLLKVRQKSTLAYRDSNLTINDQKIQELDEDLEEGKIDQQNYKAARAELDRELLIDIPAENKDTAALHYVGSIKRHPAMALLISVFIPMLALLLYLDLGMHNASEETFVASQKQTQTQTQQTASVEEMTAKLEAKIEREGGSVQEWIMLGRAQKHLGRNDLAAKAFAVALETDTQNAQLMLELAEMQALSNDRKFTEQGRVLVLKALELQPDNPNSLWFAGVAEYQYGNYHQAIAHLKKVLPLVLGEEEVMKSIVDMIARSREALIAKGEDMPELVQILDVQSLLAQVEASAPAVAERTGDAVADNATVDKARPESKPAESKSTERVSGLSLQVSVDVSEQVRQQFDASDTVFVYAKAKQGPRMPLAAQRLTLAALPAMVVLDDSMAMVEGMNLSAFDPIVISARVTKTGSAIAQGGDYIGKLELSTKDAATPLKITIDTVVR
jgi:cytochrome c-type biogenesis protein CcmH